MRFQHGELHLVLLALLAARPMHGYELMGEVGDRLGRRYRPSPGSIYPAVRSLETEGLITSRHEGDRRVYELTPAGRRALARRGEQLARLEARVGVRFGTDSVDASLARLAERVHAMAHRVDAARLQAFFDRTMTALGSLDEEDETR